MLWSSQTSHHRGRLVRVARQEPIGTSDDHENRPSKYYQNFSLNDYYMSYYIYEAGFCCSREFRRLRNETTTLSMANPTLKHRKARLCGYST